jgi:hypothetical protein
MLVENSAIQSQIFLAFKQVPRQRPMQQGSESPTSYPNSGAGAYVWQVNLQAARRTVEGHTYKPSPSETKERWGVMLDSLCQHIAPAKEAQIREMSAACGISR